MRVSGNNRAFPFVRDDYLFELDALHYLDSNGISAPVVRKWRNDKDLFEFTKNGEKLYCVLFSYEEGEPSFPLNDKNLFNLGKTIAELHIKLKNFSSKYVRRKWDISNAITFSMSQLIQNLDKELSHQISKLKQIESWMVKVLEQNKDIPHGLVHGDVHNYNVSIQPNGDLTLLDFDFMGECGLIFDVACFFGSEKWFAYEFENNIKIENHKFIEGYNSVRKLSKTELKLLPVYEIMRYLILFGAWSKIIAIFGKTQWRNKSVKDFLIGRIKYILPHIQKLKAGY